MCFLSPPTGCLFACSLPLHHFMFRFKCHFPRLPSFSTLKVFFLLPSVLTFLCITTAHPITSDSSTWSTLHSLQTPQQVGESLSGRWSGFSLLQAAQLLSTSFGWLDSSISFRQLGWSSSSRRLRLSRSVSRQSLQLTYPWEGRRSGSGTFWSDWVI